VAKQLFVFVQMEFPWVLGPADGRYLLRTQEGGEPEHVIVLETLASGRERSARRPSRLTRRGGAQVPPEPEPEPVGTTRVTVIDPISLSAENQARAWLEGIEDEREAQTTGAVINRILYYYRIAAAHPYVHEVSPGQALVIRAGWGEGEQVAGGRWLYARELTLKLRPVATGAVGRGRARGRAVSLALRPQERFAELLGAKDRTLVCEELALRARVDLDQGRPRHAVLELERALVLAPRELRAEARQDLSIRIAELEQLHAGVGKQAAAVLATPASEPDVELLTHALERLEAALRARSATGFSLK
jgi:hypothetical protein